MPPKKAKGTGSESDSESSGDDGGAEGGAKGGHAAGEGSGSFLQIGVGVSFGLVAGCLDTKYIEPFGVIIGGSLLVLQLLDHEEVFPIFWNSKSPKRRRKNAGILDDLKEFTCKNLFMAGGFAAGYYAGANFLVDSNFHIGGSAKATK